MRLIAVILLLLATFLLSAQDSVIVRGVVLSADTDSPIEGSHIRVVEGDGTAVTDDRGRFTVQVSRQGASQIRVEVRHLNYEAELVRFRLAELLAGEPIRIRMNPIVHPLGTVEILSEYAPEVIYGSPRHSIADYEFLGDSILILTYEKRLEKSAKLYLLNQDLQAVDSVSLPLRLKAIGLERDYADEVYIRGRERMYQAVFDEYGLRAIRIDKDQYEQQIVPVIAQVDDRFVFHTRSEHLPFFEYYVYDGKVETYTHLLRIADEDMLTMCRAEYKYLSTRDKLNMFRMELETGVEKELLTCMASFEGVPYYRTPYAPAFQEEQTVVVFDHPAELIRRVDLDGAPVDSVPIHYHAYHKVMNNPFQRVVHDLVGGEFYALMQHPGGRANLDRIDMETGKTSRVFTFTYDYPEAVQVKGGEVFYTYRPFGSLQKKFLYQEVIVDPLPLVAH
ncbi:MAG: carboxypeptidase regulatory-like domain-containing protein [Flavobacteriales bacterium]|nr:carboxypeptidase regulatory-like domain-containing protein [Flavobacteriales bacterium]